MRDIVVMGAGGTAREVAALLRALNRRSPEWNVLGYVERDASRTGSLVADLPVLGSAQWLHERESETSVAFAIGTPAFIVRAHAEVADLPYLDYPNLIHPTVVMDEGRIRMGVGNVICAGNILTTDIAVGSFNYLNSASTFGHDMEIEDYCVVNPGCNLSGGVRIGSRCLIGTNATILQYLEIGHDSIVGAGAVVTKDVEPGVVVAGVPARVLRRVDAG